MSQEVFGYSGAIPWGSNLAEWKAAHMPLARRAAERAADMAEAMGDTVLGWCPNPWNLMVWPLVGVQALQPVTVAAATTSATKIMAAMNPIVDLLQGISYPVAFVMVSGGFLMFMVGRREKGLEMIKWAAVGFIGMQFVPSIMAILVEVGQAVRSAQ